MNQRRHGMTRSDTHIITSDVNSTHIIINNYCLDWYNVSLTPRQQSYVNNRPQLTWPWNKCVKHLASGIVRYLPLTYSTLDGALTYIYVVHILSNCLQFGKLYHLVPRHTLTHALTLVNIHWRRQSHIVQVSRITCPPQSWTWIGFIHGLDWIGLDWIGLDWVQFLVKKFGLDWIGSNFLLKNLDWIGLGHCFSEDGSTFV